MKIFGKTLLIPIVMLCCALTGYAQNNKKAAKEAEIKRIVESKNYTFTARNVSPMRGMTRDLTSEYDLRITKDSVISFLPYFGRAYTAPMNPTEGGIKFTSTKFSYTLTAKKSGYEVTIKPTDVRDVRVLILTITPSGYGNLTVTSNNRDLISFYGSIEENTPKKK